MPMQSTYTLGDLKTRVRMSLSAKNNDFFKDSDIQTFAVEAHRKINYELMYYKTTASENSVINQFEYGFPDNCIMINTVYFNGVSLNRRSISWLNSRGLGWRNLASSTPENYYILPMSKYGLQPAPTAILVVKVEGVFIPAFPVNDASFFTIPPQIEDALIYLTCAHTAWKDITGFGAAQYAQFMEAYKNIVDMVKNAASESDGVVVGESAKIGSNIYMPRPNTVPAL